MANPTVFDSTATNPGGTGSTLTVTLSAHAVDDYLLIFVANTGNALWAGNPAGWNRLDQRSVGNAGNGVIGTWLWRKVVSGDTLPLSDPVCTLGATSTRAAVCRTIRDADLEGAFTLPEWGARAFATGTGNPVSPPGLTTVAPEMLVLHCYGQRAATDAPDPTDYTQDQEIVISGTLVLNASRRTVADQNTALTNQDASPTSGARWAAGILCIPSPDYVYYRSGSQALTAAGTTATPALPAGASASDNQGNKDLIIATIEAEGTPTIAPNTPADWTQIAGEWATTTSGDGTTVRKYWTHYDGTLDRQFNRSTSGELFVYFSVYRNTHQTSPIGAIEAQQNASSTSSTFPSLARTAAKSTIQATCVADATPTYTTPAGWIERNDSNGIVCADQAFNASGTVSSASFTLSSASPTACGLVEILSVPPPITTFESSAAIDAVASIVAAAQAFTVFEREGTISATGEIVAVAQFFSVFERSASLDAAGLIASDSTRALLRSATVSATADISTVGAYFTILERALELTATADILVSGQALQAFAVIERSATVDGAASIAATGTRAVQRAAACNASASVESSAEFFTTFELAITLSAAAVVEASGAAFSVLEAAVTLSTTANVESSAISFSITERTAAVAATASLESLGVRIAERSSSFNAAVAIGSSAESFSIVERTSAVSGTATITVTAVRVAERVLSLAAIAGISVTAESVSLEQRSAQLDAAASIAIAAEFFSTLERSTALSSSAAVSVSGQTELFRQSLLNSVPSISVSGNVIPPDAVDYERSVTLDAACLIISAAESFSVHERFASFSATSTLTITGQSEFNRAALLNAVGIISTVGQAGEYQRSVSFNASGSIQSNGESYSYLDRSVAIDGVGLIAAATAAPYPRNQKNIPAENRTITVSSENRTVTVPAEN